MTHIYSEAVHSHREDDPLPSATTWMDFENIMPSETSRRESQEPCGFTPTWDIKLKAAHDQMGETNKQNLMAQTTLWRRPDREGVRGSKGYRGSNKKMEVPELRLPKLNFPTACCVLLTLSHSPHFPQSSSCTDFDEVRLCFCSCRGQGTCQPSSK